MKTRKLLPILAVVFGLTAFTTSCTQIENITASTEAIAITAGDEAQAATLSDDITNEVDNYVNTSSFIGYLSAVRAVSAAEQATGPTITVDKKDSVNFPKTITIDYGTTGITGKRGNILKGKIIVVVSNKMWIANSSRTITFVDFSINDNAIRGYKNLTYKGLNADKNPYWTISVKDTMDRADKSTIIWNSERTRTRIDNNNTSLIFWDDHYSITGTSNGVNAKGIAYTMVIDNANPLIIGGLWPFFTKGTVTITTENKTAIIDYGDGTLDNKATVNVNGVTKEITLRK